MRKMKTLPFIKAKHILLYGVLLFLSQAILAQSTYIYVDTAARLVTKKKGYIYIPGNLVVHNNGMVHNEDSIFLKGSLDNGEGALFQSSSNYFLSNDDTIRPQVGNVVFMGNKRQHVKSKSTEISFSRLTIANPNYNLILDTSVYAFGTIQMRTNNLNLAGNNINTFVEDLYKLNTGKIGKEGPYLILDTTYIETHPDIAKGKGYIKAWVECNTCPDHYKTLGIKLTDQGALYIDRGHLQLNDAGDGSIHKFFKIHKEENSASFNIDGSITITYLDPLDFQGLNINEPDFRIFLKQNPVNASQSNSLVEYKNWGGTLDAENNTVTINGGTNIPNPGIFTIADQDCKNPPRVELGPAIVNICEKIPFSLIDTVTQNPYSQSIYYKWFVNGIEDATVLTRDYKDTLDNSQDTVKYTLIKIDNRGCYSRDSVKVIVRPKPQALFKKIHTFYCKDESFALTDSSKIADNSALSYYWSFGDTNISTSKDVTHSYASTGDFRLLHKVTSTYSCWDTISVSETINAIPNADFTFDRSCNSKEVVFHNISTIRQGESFSKAVWIFEPDSILDLSSKYGKEPMLDNIAHNYKLSGTKTVTLTMTGSGSCSASISKDVEISTENTLQFTAGNTCAESPVAIENTSTISSSAPSWYWDFGDGSFSTLKDPEKTYTRAGSYNIKMKVKLASCADSLIKHIDVYALPNANFTVDNACANKDISFIPEDESYPSYSWKINGNNNTSTAPILKFSNSGLFDASLIVATNKGCKAEVSKKFSVYASPKPNFTYQKVCFGNPTLFYNQSTIQSGSLTYRWMFTDEDSSLNPNASYTYTDTAGIRPVKLVATSNNGCADSITQQVEVYPLPHKGLAESLQVCGSSYAIDATVNNPRYTVASYTWSNGVKTAVNTVTSDNTYSLTMRTSNGCSATESIAISFGSSLNIKLPATQTFCGSGILDAGYDSQYSTWSTGEKERIINVDRSGVYTVNVQMNDCKASATTNVTVNNNPIVELGQDINTCSGEKVTLNAGSVTATYKWSNGAITPAINVSSSAIYKVSVTSAEGCQVTDKITVSFRPSPLKTLPKEVTTCKEAVLDAGNRGATYEWSTLETSRSTIVRSSGMYWVKITNAENCSVTDSSHVIVLPSANINLGSDITICEGNSVTLNAGNNGPNYSYRWNGIASQSSIYTARKSGTYIVEAINGDNSCITADTLIVYYKISPRVILGNDRMICSSDNITLDAGNPGSLVQWKSTNGFSSTQQTIDVNQPGTYSVTVMNSEGCVGFDTLTVYPSAGELVAEYIVASTVRAGDTVHFVNVSHPEPYTCLWRFGDGVKSEENSPTHIFFIRDTFDVKLTISNGYCSATDTKSVIVSGFKNKLLPGEGDGSGQFLQILSSNIFPNPTHGEFTFEIRFSATTNMMVSLHDIKGQLYYVESIKNVEEYSRNYSFEKLPAGIYIFKATSGKLSQTYKIVKN
jgi:PKD repeat protein